MTASKLRLYHRLQIAAHRAQRAADRTLLDAAGVTTAQAAVLAIVAREAGPTQREVAAQLGVNDSAVTAMAMRLIDLGLLVRTRDRDDTRAWRLALSETGRAALKRVEKSFSAVNAKFDAAMSAREMAQFADCLSRVGAAFDET